MYSAQIQGCKSNMAVTLYQGDGAKDRWKEDISQYLEFRHPYLAQVYGIVSTANLHAVVFHDDLIPYTELLEKYNSHSSTVFFWACMDSDFSVKVLMLLYSSELSFRRMSSDIYSFFQEQICPGRSVHRGYVLQRVVSASISLLLRPIPLPMHMCMMFPGHLEPPFANQLRKRK
ncbi:hypothetical protein C8R44DRAFT_769310 [Mycena epipterygia]|nr:hypothetical protein C8R44DRAFT_769310 [Mycena epipterygia]